MEISAMNVLPMPEKTVEQLKEELADMHLQWSAMYQEREKYKEMAQRLFTALKTANALSEIEKELQ